MCAPLALVLVLIDRRHTHTQAHTHLLHSPFDDIKMSVGVEGGTGRLPIISLRSFMGCLHSATWLADIAGEREGTYACLAAAAALFDLVKLALVDKCICVCVCTQRRRASYRAKNKKFILSERFFDRHFSLPSLSGLFLLHF